MNTFSLIREKPMPWKECSAMDKRLQFVASRRADGGTLQEFAFRARPLTTRGQADRICHFECLAAALQASAR